MRYLYLFLLATITNYAFAADKAPLSTDQIAALLGWTPAATEQYSCGGYYQDPLAALINHPLPPLATTPIKIDAGATSFERAGVAILTGRVMVQQPGRWLQADRAELYGDPSKNKLERVKLMGKVTMREPGHMVVGKNGDVEFASHVAHFNQAFYRLAVTAITDNDMQRNLNAWGQADTVEQKPSGMIELRRATYTTCAPTTNTWHVTAAKIDINRDAGRGYAHDVWLKVKDVPVFYTPYFNFPIDQRRQSGFLFPTTSISSQSGFNLNIPYYWNIAPNYDFLITPEIFTKRGVQLNGLFRYLTTTSEGNVNASFLPHDSDFADFRSDIMAKYTDSELRRQLLDASDNRGFFSWQNITHFDPRWSGSVNYNYVSDSYYYQDFGNPATLIPNQLPQQGVINYSGDNWSFTGQLQTFQTLHLINQVAINNPYSRLPELDFNGDFPNEAYGLHYQLYNQFVYFDRKSNPDEKFIFPNTAPPNAGRFHIQPDVSLPLTGLSGYLIPSLQLSTTQYEVGNQVPGFASSITRALPIFSIDSGLYFDRTVKFAQTSYQQTLEPRIFYLYVPYRNQDDIPIFDTALIPFTYDSLFATNRFSGIDRIGDANQVALAVSTRFLDQTTGAEKFRAGIGEIYYFQDRRVTMCASAGTPGSISQNIICTNPLAIMGATSPTERISPIAGQASYHFNPTWSTTANVAWDPEDREMVNGGLNLQYSPQQNRIFSVNYNYIRFGDPVITDPSVPVVLTHQNDLHQVGFSFAWPLRDNWGTVGGWNYNISHAYPQSYFYGLEYNSCCWAVRVVAGRTFSALDQNGGPIFNNSIYLQWQFKGLGTVGTQDPTDMLKNNIPGYQDSFRSLEGLAI